MEDWEKTEKDLQSGGWVRTAKDLFAGAAGGITQVLMGTWDFFSRMFSMPLIV
jgi:solute carrier family 25 carnitine/acylcarnitine transporter 20/29